MMEYNEWSGVVGNTYEDPHFENNGFLTSLVEDDQHYQPDITSNTVSQSNLNSSVQNYDGISFPQPDPAQPQFNHQLPAYHQLVTDDTLVDQNAFQRQFNCNQNEIQVQPNDESLYSLLHEDNQSYWTQNGYQNGPHANTQFSYYQTDPYQQGYSQVSGYNEDYNYWDGRHYPFQSGQAPVYVDYAAPQYQIDQHGYGINNTPTSNHMQHHLHHHQDIHHPPVPPEKPLLKCETCDKTISSPYTFQRHKKRKDHDNVKDYRCELCNETFTLSHHLNRHYSRVHRKLIGDIGQAATGLPSLKTVYGQKKNTRKISDLITGLIELFECYYCHEVFQRYDDFRAHLTSTHADLKKWVCPHKWCDANFDTLEELLEHARKGNVHEKVVLEKPISSLRCPVCRVEFSRQDALRRHLRSHDKKRLECPFRALSKCNRTFNRVDSLKTHLEHHNDPKFKSAAFLCDICARVFGSSAQLEKHKTVHPNPKLKVYCKRCNKGFRHPHSLRIHSCPVKAALSEKISTSMRKKSRLKKLARQKRQSEPVNSHSDSETETTEDKMS